MFFVRRPAEAVIRRQLEERSELPFSYSSVGCTRDLRQDERGWKVDRERVLLGHGEAAFQRARQAIEQWRMFPREVAEVCWPEAAICPGSTVGVLYWAAPVQLWMLMPARIVYVIDGVCERSRQNVEQFGFAYGTLPGHPERGEERFLVEWNRADDSVCYELLAVSQPAHWIARIGYFYARYEQARFRKWSGRAMQGAVDEQRAGSMSRG